MTITNPFTLATLTTTPDASPADVAENPRHPLRDAVCGYEPPSRVRDDVRRTRSMIERGLTKG